jgi:hypothetical protein
MKPIAQMFVIFVVLFAATFLRAQTCESAGEMDPGAKSALDSTAKQDYQLAQSGDLTRLQQNAAPAFSGLKDTVSNNKGAFAGEVKTRVLYVMDVPNTPASSNSNATEFFCGVFNSPDRVAFEFPKLAPGRYAVVIQDAAGQTPYTISWIFQQISGQWKIADLILRPQKIGGHDAVWFVTQARAFKNKGEFHNAWLYYREADDLLRPFRGLSAPALERLYDEADKIVPNDLPVKGPVDFIANGKTYKLVRVYPYAVGDALNLVVRYQVPDLSDTNKTFQDNAALMQALVTRYPEYRNAFAGVLAVAVDPSGRDFSSMLAMNKLK